MSESQTFHADCIQLLHEQFAKGRIDRRRFLQLGAALGLAPVLGSIPEAQAQTKEIVMVTTTVRFIHLNPVKIINYVYTKVVDALYSSFFDFHIITR